MYKPTYGSKQFHSVWKNPGAQSPGFFGFATKSYKVRFCAPVELDWKTDGKKVYPENSVLDFTVNTAWFDEQSILYGYSRTEFEKVLESATVEYAEKTTCSLWSGQ